MKYLFVLLILLNNIFASDTTYIDGSYCYCDSIKTILRKTGEINYEISYLNGYKNKLQIEYYKSGKIAEETYYYNDIVISRHQYWENGKLYSEETYEKGKIAERNKFLDGGNIMSTEFYKNGKNFRLIEYYDDGSVYQEYIYLTNEYTKVNEFYKNGSLASTKTYKNGKLVGFKKCSDGRFGNENLDCMQYD